MLLSGRCCSQIFNIYHTTLEDVLRECADLLDLDEDQVPGRDYIPPPSPHFWPEGIFQGRGVGVYILRPHAAGSLYAPPFYTPPPPPLEGCFQGWGVGVYKIWPRTGA